MTAIIDDRVAELERANADLQRQLAECAAQLKEAREQQTATAEVLQVINSSPGDLAPVFDAMLEKGVRLSEAAFGVLCTFDGECFRPAAMHAVPAPYAEHLSRRPLTFARGSGPAHILAGQRFHAVADFAADELTRSGDPIRRALVELGGARTGLAVALRRDAALVGMFLVFRQEVRPFTDKQIALLQNFAAQAVIAMENARLLTETREALEQQTATAEVLQVINSSPGDLTPVFDAMIERASLLCDAAFGCLWIYDGERMHAAALRGAPPDFAAFLTRAPHPVGPDNAHGRLLRGEPVVHIADVADDEAYRAGDPVRRNLVELGGGRTLLAVPLSKDGQFLGDFVMYRTEVRPFSDKQIALLQNFAAQAVIAMENARLLTETREALEQQTATAEVLQVINSSPGELSPVFNAMLEKATWLCEAAFGELWTYDGHWFEMMASRGMSADFAEFLRGRHQMSPETAHGRVLAGENVVHIHDIATTELYRSGDPHRTKAVEQGGVRSLLAVSLRKDEKLLGILNMYRQEVRPFSDKQIALLQNFAAQAVIAMENARLLAETREALEQQTATAEVLQVINSSPGDLVPVFDAMLEKAMRLCEAGFGILWTFDGERFYPAAVHGLPAAFAEFLRRPIDLSDAAALGDIARARRFMHVADLAASGAHSESPLRRATVDLGGARTGLGVPFLKDDAVLGILVIYRQEVRPFSDKQVALLQNFAAQAVIAMENARLITETREALEQQTATAEALQVINASPGDLTPVFNAMLDKALILCGASFGQLVTFDGSVFRATAWRGYEPGPGPTTPTPGMALYKLVQGEEIVHIPDITADDVYRSGNAVRRRLADEYGGRTAIWVALRKDAALLGAFVIYRTEVRPFSDKQIALLRNFAAQAVIAMENARLLNETREALEQQTATAEVLQVINSSPGDLAPVFDAMLDKATWLCEASFGTLWTYDGDCMQAVAIRGSSQQYTEFLKRGPHRPSPVQRRLIGGASVVRVADVAAGEGYRSGDPLARALVEFGGIRSLVAVPLRKEDGFLGAISVYRQEVRPFTDKQIALLQNFAAQAVIAMENARLLTETREALEQQTATAEVLQVINSSPGDLEPIFDAMLEKAARICRASSGFIFQLQDNRCRMVASFGVPAEYKDFQVCNPIPLGRGTLAGRTALERRAVHIEDAATDPEYTRVEAVQLGRQRTMLGVPLVRDDTLIGVITFARSHVEPFTDKQIELVTMFAAQAVIAMENARLITELRQRTHDLLEALEYQTASGDVLKVISQSGGELEPVLDTLVKTAARLCDAQMAFIHRRDGEIYRPAAVLGFPLEFTAFLEVHPIVPGRGSITGRVALEGRAIHIPDVTADPEYELSQSIVMAHQRTTLGVPLLRENEPIGVILLARQRVQPFTDKQIALVQTFADQAVIAIENARLFNELRQRTRDLQESLEYQTATSEVLKVISRSAFDLETVLQAVATTAVRLCRADSAAIYRNDNGEYRWAAGHMQLPDYEQIERNVRIRPGTGTLVGRVATERQTVQILDAWTDPLYEVKDDARIGGVHTMMGVPLLREGSPIGVIGLARRRVEAFSEPEIQLVTTFADQAVIAIENARLFNELRARTAELGRSVEELKMLSEVGRAVSSTLDLRTVLSTVLNASLGVTWANAGAIFRYIRGERAFRLVEAVGWDEPLLHSVRDLRVAEAETAMGEAATRRMPIQIADLAERPSAPLRNASLAAGFHSALIVPLVGPERVLGAIILMRQEVGEFPLETVRLMQTLASQSVLAIQNARLFREIADKSEQLALASQHKSQFLANMSHELRTPLNAILGYAELLVDGIYGQLPDRPRGVLERIQNNGKHLLALINDVLDLAKIEAGQLTLTLEDYSLAEVVQTVVTATEPLASAKGLKFVTAMQNNLPMAHGDARRVSQVLLNLVGNAIKFTDAGEVEIRATADKSQFALTVRDTGPGIADADQERIFGEFQQIDNSNTRKQGGTGLGLAISKRMVELQGGTISVDSALGQGSTFRVVIPIHVDQVMEEAA